MSNKSVPAGWWQVACEAISYPLACVSKDNKFIWVNQAFEKLLGYSISELKDMTWMDITTHTTLGGDLASTNDIIEGEIFQYSISKKYRHKFGYEIPVQISVWRFPRNITEIMLCFIIEVSPETLHYDQFINVIENLEKRINYMEEKTKTGGGISVNVGDTAGGDNVGQDKITNNSLFLVLLSIVGIVSTAALIAAIYTIFNGN